jgi:hypothetical protein
MSQGFFKEKNNFVAAMLKDMKHLHETGPGGGYLLQYVFNHRFTLRFYFSVM